MPNKPKPIRPSWVPERKAFARRKDNSSFYNSWKWRKTAKAFRESNPCCVKCEAEGIVSATEYVDHIERIEGGGEKYDHSNLQGLCKFHHNSKSGKEAHGYKEKPKEK